MGFYHLLEIKLTNRKKLLNAASKTGIHASKKVVDSFYATG